MITKNLDVSTMHITKKDAVLLDEAAGCSDTPPVVVYKYPEGYFVYVPQEESDFMDTTVTVHKVGFSRNFIYLMSYARQNKCKYVQLDCDGETYPNMTTNEW